MYEKVTRYQFSCITCENRYQVFRVAIVEYQYTYLLYHVRTSRAKSDTGFSELQLSNTSTRIYYIMFVHHVRKSIPGFQSCSCRIPVHISTISCSYITCEKRYRVFRVAVVEYQYTYLLYYVRTSRANIDTRFSELQLSNTSTRIYYIMLVRIPRVKIDTGFTELQLSNTSTRIYYIMFVRTSRAKIDTRFSELPLSKTSTRIYYIMFVHHVQKSIPGFQSCSCRIPVHVYTISCSFVHHVQKSIRGFLSCSCRKPEYVSIISCSYVHHVRKSIPGLQSCSCRIPEFTKI